MKTNLEKVLERDGKLSELDHRAGQCLFLFNLNFLGIGNFVNIAWLSNQQSLGAGSVTS